MKTNKKFLQYFAVFLFIAFLSFLKVNAQTTVYPWVDLAHPNHATNITNNSAVFNAVLSYNSAMNANTTAEVWFEYYEWHGSYDDIVRQYTTKQTISYTGGQEYPQFNFSGNGINLMSNKTYCVEAYATNEAGSSQSTALCFLTSGSGEEESNKVIDVDTLSTNEYADTYATFKGRIITLQNIPTAQYYFLYKKQGDSSYSQSYTGTRTAVGDFTIQMTNLVSGTTYCYKAVARDNNDVTTKDEGTETCFTTSGGDSSNGNLRVETLSTNEYGNNWGRFKGRLTEMTNISEVEYWFTYKKDGSSTEQTTQRYRKYQLGDFNVQATNLSYNSRYCYIAHAKDYNSSTYANGTEICFTTGNNTGDNNYGLRVNTLAYDYISDDYAVLRGEIENMGNANEVKYYFEYYEANNTNKQITVKESKRSEGSFSTIIYSLKPSTRYCYRAIGYNTSNQSEKDQGTETCFVTLRQGEGGDDGGDNEKVSYKICYKGAVVYVEKDSSNKKVIWTKGLLSNNTAVQRYNSEDEARNFIDKQGRIFTQCKWDGQETDQKNKYHYCRLDGKCVETNSSYVSKLSCEYSVRTYLAGQTTNICYSSSNDCSINCSAQQGTPQGSGSNTEMKKYYYCQLSDNQCVQTNGTYGNADICGQSLSIYKQGQSTGTCYEEMNQCSLSCGSGMQEPIANVTPEGCNDKELLLETLDFSEIDDTSRTMNGRVSCVYDKNTNVGFEYYGKSENSMTAQKIWLNDYNITIGEVMEFNYKLDNLELGVTYCYKAIAKVWQGEEIYGQEVCYPDTNKSDEGCQLIISEYMTEPFEGLCSELYIAMGDNCGNGNISEECLIDVRRGFEVRMEEMRVEYMSQKDELRIQIEKMISRNGFVKFFIGSDYGSIAKINLYLERNIERIKIVRELKREYYGPCAILLIDKTVELLEKENEDITIMLEANSKGFSLFGWLVKIFY